MSRPPECDAACRAKILLNSQRVRQEAESAQILSNYLSELDLFSGKEGQQLINLYDEFEDKLIEYNNRLLAKTGYKRKTKKFELEVLDGD